MASFLDKLLPEAKRHEVLPNRTETGRLQTLEGIQNAFRLRKEGPKSSDRIYLTHLEMLKFLNTVL